VDVRLGWPRVQTNAATQGEAGQDSNIEEADLGPMLSREIIVRERFSC